MPPIDLPPTNPTAALARDRNRPQIVATRGTVQRPADAPVEQRHEPAEWPHGGEPNVRSVWATLANSSSSNTYRASFVVFDETWRDSASHDLTLGVTGQPLWKIPAMRYNPKSTEGMAHKQHRARNVEVARRSHDTTDR